MLLRFAVSNYLSFQSRQEFSLLATSLKDASASLLPVGTSSKLKALPVALLFGANASGKSNAFLALRFMVNCVRLSHRSGNPEGGVPRVAFALSKDHGEKPSVFEVDFVVDGIRYHYGFECNDHEFSGEWLYSYPQGTRRKMYDRVSSKEIEFGPSLRGAKKILNEMMRHNSLFLSVAAQNNHEQLGPIAAFLSGIKFNGEISIEATRLMYEFSEDEVDERTIMLLNNLGTGIVGVEKKKSPISEKDRELRNGILGVIAKIHGQNVPLPKDDEQETVIRLIHQGAGDQPVPFDMARESSGTRRLLMLLNSIFKALDEGGVVVVDELDASLHTYAASALLALFTDPATNSNGAQLIATAHDTNLMLSENLRRDEVWFVQKNDTGASSIYPLAEFQTRSTDNIERGYMQGRFGALPYTGSAQDWLRGQFGTTNSPVTAQD